MEKLPRPNKFKDTILLGLAIIFGVTMSLFILSLPVALVWGIFFGGLTKNMVLDFGHWWLFKLPVLVFGLMPLGIPIMGIESETTPLWKKVGAWLIAIPLSAILVVVLWYAMDWIGSRF